MSETGSDDSKIVVRITQEHRAILSSLISVLPQERQCSIADAIKLGVEQWMLRANDASIFCTTCLSLDLESKTFLMNRDPSEVGGNLRDYRIPKTYQLQIDSISRDVGRRWIFTSGKMKGRSFDLSGDQGLAKCLFSAALHYLIASRFKSSGNGVSLEVPKKGDYLKPSDRLMFYFCTLDISGHTGSIYRREVTLDINSRHVKFGSQNVRDNVQSIDYYKEMEKQDKSRQMINSVLIKGENVSNSPSYDRQCEPSM
jgi:hypothetical protein